MSAPGSLGPLTPERFGREVLGPVVAEFCLRLWELTTHLVDPEDATLLFCARGGLRMQLAYEQFLRSSALEPASQLRPLMVSRLAAVRPVVARSLREERSDLLPAAAASMSKEFSPLTVAQAVRAVSGLALPPGAAGGSEPFSPVGFMALLRSPAGAEARAAVEEQSDLFLRHLQQQTEGRRHAVLVDTGLYGTTRDLLAQAGVQDMTTSCVLLARSFRPGTARDHRTFGLSVTAHDYSPLLRRSALLRYWHFVEWLFEPELPSVTRFSTGPGGRVRSDLEITGWADRVSAEPGSAFAGVLEHLAGLPPAPGLQVVEAADRAWSELRRAIVLPRGEHGDALAVGTRSHGFGREETWNQPDEAGLWAILVGDGMWREGQLARTQHPLRLPALVALEAGYGVRGLMRAVGRRVR